MRVGPFPRTMDKQLFAQKPPPPRNGMGLGADMGGGSSSSSPAPNKKKPRRGNDAANQKRRCVSTACIACRRRKSKCDAALPSCAACASVYGTECVYDPNSDHRRKGVYREKIDSMKAQSSTLQILIEAILNASEEDVPAIVKRIRTCDSLDAVAESIMKDENSHEEEEDDDDLSGGFEYTTDQQPFAGERDLARKMGELRLENGLVRFIGGTSHLIYLGDPNEIPRDVDSDGPLSDDAADPFASWTEVTKDTQLIVHLINMYFAWHYPYFTTLSRSLFYRDLLKGKQRGESARPSYCSSLLVNAILALGCHFTSVPGAFGTLGDGRTKGDRFFAEAKRLIVVNDEYEKPRLTTVQALALMSVREAGCGREAKGWVYSGMSFRMAQDIGLNLDAGAIKSDKEQMDEQQIDARRVTFWGCFLFDKAWSNYLGRLPQLPKNSFNVPKYDVFPDEDAEMWSPYTDTGFDKASQQPSRTRAVGLQLSQLCEISSDLLLFFYHPNHIGRSSGKSVELKKLSELHRRLEDWRKALPTEFEPKEDQLPNVILMHMFFHLQYIHLFRPFLRYAPANSPLPSHVSPRRICTANAGAISKLMRLYKKTYNLRQICNIAVYMVHSACTIHLLNLPEKTARRDVIHGVKQLEEIAEDWPCARRTLSILSVLSRKWGVEMPEEASIVLRRTDEMYGGFSTADVPSPSIVGDVSTPAGAGSYANSPPAALSEQQQQFNVAMAQASTPAAAQPQRLDQNGHGGAIRSQVMMGGGYEPRSTPSPGARLQQHPPKPAVHSVQKTGHGSNGLDGGSSSNSGGGMNPNAPMSMAEAMASMNAWPMQDYSNPYTANTPVATAAGGVVGGMNGSSRVSPASARTPNSVYAVDGQEWYLKDGVNWQQNFETWDLGNSNGSGGVAAMQDPSAMFMFRGMRGAADGDSIAMLDSLSPGMEGLDRLPGLD
ncbi:hypothetical protein RB595_001701 [Gaeumannomyces hyphopodioides]